MVKVITYGTYDLLHYGHIRLLERAKALGDYLVVGVTSDDYDLSRGKINVQQSVLERVEAVKATGLADEIIVEEYEGQKIDDIRKMGIDIFAIGSDWVGKFDYINEYCKVVYLERTEGVSSSQLRSHEHSIHLGIVCDASKKEIKKYITESHYVNGINIIGCYLTDGEKEDIRNTVQTEVFDDLEKMFDLCDAVYIATHPKDRYLYVKKALTAGKNVLCKSPLALTHGQCVELFDLAREKELILLEAIKTAYSTAYNRLLVMAKSGRIGKILSVETTCTSMVELEKDLADADKAWNSICMWGPVGVLPVFQLLGTDYRDMSITSKIAEGTDHYDLFTRLSFIFQDAVATVKVGKGFKSEGELIISGTKGYIYVPAPWWKTEYFEVRFEDPSNNRRYFYQLEGEGIRYELLAFLRSIETKEAKGYLTQETSEKIATMIEAYYTDDGVNRIS